MTKYFIISGTSKGLGAELSKQLLQENHHVICISRRENNEVMETSKKHKFRYDFISADFSRTIYESSLFDQIIKKINKNDSELICLINNAAVVTPLGSIDRCNPRDIALNVHTNMISPIILTSRFLDITKEWKAKKIIINISSGSGKEPAGGMSVYCSTKAAINMFTKCVSLEQEDRVNPTKIYSVDPGMMDTEMQATARNSTSDFPLKVFFEEAKREGKLKKSNEVARKIIRNYIFKTK